MIPDLRFALRLLRRNPAPTAIALLSIALTTGAGSVVFAAIKSVLIDRLPYADPARLVQLRTEYPRMARQSAGDWIEWNDALEVTRRTRTLESVGIHRNAVFNLAGDPSAPPEALYGQKISANLFPLLGVSPMLGRNILPEEDQPGRPEEMILSYGLWVRRFHSDPNIVGHTVNIDGHACTVMGVMPADFNFPMRRAATRTPSPYVEFWAPLSVDPSARSGGLGAVARLRPGVSLAEARQDVASILSTNRDAVLRINLLRDRIVGGARNGLVILMAAALLFLCVGCSNVANLLLARGFARRAEISIRQAIGAGHGRLVRQLLTESCVLACLGGLLGFLLAAAAWKILPAIAPVSIPRLAAARVDSTIFLFALSLAVINGILFGIAPALRAAKQGPIVVTRTTAASRDRMRSSLVVAEIAVAVVLVVLGGQLLGAFVRLIAVDPGFQADRVLASVVLPYDRYRDPAARALLFRRILNAVRALPGVDSAGTVDALPFSGENHGGFVTGGGLSSPTVLAEIDITGGDYLQTMGVRLLEGRWFREEEMSGTSEAAIVNAVVARRLWPGASAVGQRICLYCTPGNPSAWKRVIGVVSSANHASLDEPEGGNVYLAAQALERAVFVVVRTGRPAGEIAAAIRRAIAAIDPAQPVLLSATMRELMADTVADRRFMVTLLAITGCLALLLSAAGVYGVISYTTSRRTQEIGIRMAIGATPGRVFVLIFRQGFFTVSVGLVIGLWVALAAMRSLRSVLPGLDSSHPAEIFLAAALVSVTAAIACWIPARRATTIDPLSALRQE